jgi:hypothetical protein
MSDRKKVILQDVSAVFPGTFLLSIVSSCADQQLARCPRFSVLLVLER